MQLVSFARDAYEESCLPVEHAVAPLLLATTFCRASGSAEAAIRLTGMGFGFDAVKLGRSVLEDAHVAAWLGAGCIDAEEARERALGYRAIQGMVDDQYPAWVSDEVLGYVATHFPDSRAKRGYWTGRSPNQLLLEVEARWRGDTFRDHIVRGLRALAHQHYPGAHAAVHNSPLGMEPFGDGVVVETGEPVLLTGPTWHSSGRALDLAVMPLMVTTDIVVREAAGHAAAARFIRRVQASLRSFRVEVHGLVEQERARRRELQTLVDGDELSPPSSE
jgi:hypothetical protein